MFIGHLAHPQTFVPLLTQAAWQQVITWLNKESATKPDGEYEIQGRNIFAIVQSLTTIPRAEGKFEAHREYIDLHSCIEGEEIIEWAPVDTLAPNGEFNSSKDYGHYLVPDQAIATHFTPGVFGIYFPADAHMPKIAPKHTGPLKKVVIKIRVF